MTNEETRLLAIKMIGFDYFKNCIKNGATEKEAKAEMLTEDAQLIMAERIKLILK